MDAPHFTFTSPLHPLAKAMDDALSEFNSTEAPKLGGEIATQVPGVKTMLQLGGSMISMTMVLLKLQNYFTSNDLERGEERLVPSTSLCHAWRCGKVRPQRGGKGGNGGDGFMLAMFYILVGQGDILERFHLGIAAI